MRLPFDGSYPITVTFEGHLTSSIEAARKNPGVDFGMPEGVPLYSVENGTATNHTDQYGGKWTRLISDDNKREWRYVHLSKFGHTGKVDTGMHIGFSGCTGLCYGPHLHLGCLQGGTFIDPMTLLSQSNPVEEALKKILKTQRPDVISAGIPILSWWYNDGVHELRTRLQYIGRNDVLKASLSVPDGDYWLLNWYITTGHKEYPDKPYVWGANPTPKPHPCQSYIDALKKCREEAKKKEAEYKGEYKRLSDESNSRCERIVLDTIENEREKCEMEKEKMNKKHTNKIADIEAKHQQDLKEMQERITMATREYAKEKTAHEKTKKQLENCRAGQPLPASEMSIKDALRGLFEAIRSGGQ